MRHFHDLKIIVLFIFIILLIDISWFINLWDNIFQFCFYHIRKHSWMAVAVALSSIICLQICVTIRKCLSLFIPPSSTEVGCTIACTVQVVVSVVRCKRSPVMITECVCCVASKISQIQGKQRCFVSYSKCTARKCIRLFWE